MISKQAIDIAFAFLHQKLQVYMYSSMEWQRDDIEMAVGDYVQQMNHSLYTYISNGLPEFLLTHSRFEHDLQQAVKLLENYITP